jgi:hypothetical protein
VTRVKAVESSRLVLRGGEVDSEDVELQVGDFGVAMLG